MTPTFNYRHLHYFWVVAREGGMSRAAARLGMSVQAVSRARHAAFGGDDPEVIQVAVAEGRSHGEGGRAGGMGTCIFGFLGMKFN